MSTETKKNPPVEKIRVGGVQAAIWKRTVDDRTFYTASFELSYKDGDGYKTSGSFGRRDILNLAKAALLAHSAIGKLSRADRVSDDEDGE